MPQVRDLYREAFRRHLTLDFVHPAADLSGLPPGHRPRALPRGRPDRRQPDGLGPRRRNAGRCRTSAGSSTSATRCAWAVPGPVPGAARARGRGVRTPRGGPGGPDRDGRRAHLREPPLDRRHPARRRAAAIATHPDQWYAGRAAIAHHRFGRGKRFYVGTQLGRGGPALAAGPRGRGRGHRRSGWTCRPTSRSSTGPTGRGGGRSPSTTRPPSTCPSAAPVSRSWPAGRSGIRGRRAGRRGDRQARPVAEHAASPSFCFA